VIGILEAEEKGSPSLILNRVNHEMVKKQEMLSPEDVLDLLAIDLIGIVPEDKSVLIAANQGAPIALDKESRAGQAFRNIAARMMGDDVPYMDLEEQGGLWKRISKLTGRN
jgi:septum site-determining protein MinD